MLEQHYQTYIYRLCTGRCCLKSHLHKIGVRKSPLCECGVDQTPIHILQDCLLLQVDRLQVWPEATNVRAKLQETLDKLNRTIQFMTSIGLII